jgi:hypothetical protein
MRRIVTVTNLKLTTNNKNDGTGSTTAEFTASAYSLNTSPASPTSTASVGDPSKAGAAPAGDQKKGDKNGRKS